MPPAAATWLSLTRAASPRLIRWFSPAAARTAYFSSARSPGRVLRVSRITAPVPATASAQVLVAVAIPDRWVRKLSMVRSAPSAATASPATRSTASPGRDPAPSATSAVPETPPARGAGPVPPPAGPPRWSPVLASRSSTARATGSPATTPGLARHHVGGQQSARPPSRPRSRRGRSGSPRPAPPGPPAPPRARRAPADLGRPRGRAPRSRSAPHAASPSRHSSSSVTTSLCPSNQPACAAAPPPCPPRPAAGGTRGSRSAAVPPPRSARRRCAGWPPRPRPARRPRPRRAAPQASSPNGPVVPPSRPALSFEQPDQPPEPVAVPDHARPTGTSPPPAPPG